MTQVGRLFEEEKLEYAKEYAGEKLNERNHEIAKTLLEKNIDMATIMESTGLSREEILEGKQSPAEPRS